MGTVGCWSVFSWFCLAGFELDQHPTISRDAYVGDSSAKRRSRGQLAVYESSVSCPVETRLRFAAPAIALVIEMGMWMLFGVVVCWFVFVVAGCC